MAGLEAGRVRRFAAVFISSSLSGIPVFCYRHLAYRLRCYLTICPSDEPQAILAVAVIGHLRALVIRQFVSSTPARGPVHRYFFALLL